ncbi:nitrate- and nitrite sensing domain-containing protein [Nonomuraea salmonea]|uniref:histidine kinase n=1 Tax=Nonomuraea salmonea TaxID=46181 RepID=A0ABV5NWZ0_9ACTN
MPPTRGRPITVKLLVLLLVPLLSLVGLWAFAAGLTGGDGLRLLAAKDMSDNLTGPSVQVNVALQNERLLSVGLMMNGRGSDELVEQRRATDQAITHFQTSAARVRNLPPEMLNQLSALNVRLAQIIDIRRQVDASVVEPIDVIDGYSEIADASFRLYDSMILVPDMTLYQQAKALITMGEATEVLSRERAVIAAVLARGRVDGREREAFTGMVATRRLLHAQAMSYLDGGLRASYERLAASPVYKEWLEAEDAVKDQSPKDGLPAAAATWPIDGENLWAAVQHNQTASTKTLADRVTPDAIGMLIKIGVAAGAGLLAVVASILLSLRFRKRLVRELAALRDAATELAEVRLAGLVKRLRTNTEPPTAEEVAPLQVEADTTEVRDIVQAFNDVQATAVEAAVDQARLRHGVSQVFVNLARRNQSLLHRQLLQLDSMERAEEAPETLSDLFKLDHLTTRMRRHAESLIILSDQTPGRGWRNPVSVHDVLRAAVAEVEEYERVEVLQPPPVALIGSVVTDVAHLMAELIENATLFSPPRTRVDVRSALSPHGMVVEVEDRGLGLPRTELDELNDRLTNTPEFDLAQSDRLGLFVVSRLAARHGIKVRLVSSPYGGLTATVALPSSLLADQPAMAGR